MQVNKGNKIDLEVGRLKSRMLASLECVKVLHRCGKMDDDLDLIEEVYVDVSSENLQDLELEEGKGRPGTNKRRRAYEIKVNFVLLFWLNIFLLFRCCFIINHFILILLGAVIF